MIAPPPKRPVLNEAEFNFDLPPPEDDFRGFLDDDDDAAATRRNKKTTAKNSSFALNGDQQVQEIPVRNVPLAGRTSAAAGTSRQRTPDPLGHRADADHCCRPDPVFPL